MMQRVSANDGGRRRIEDDAAGNAPAKWLRSSPRHEALQKAPHWRPDPFDEA
jgi:hypothetical protein